MSRTSENLYDTLAKELATHFKATQGDKLPACYFAKQTTSPIWLGENFRAVVCQFVGVKPCSVVFGLN
jgi:hypothetical protein